MIYACDRGTQAAAAGDDATLSLLVRELVASYGGMPPLREAQIAEMAHAVDAYLAARAGGGSQPDAAHVVLLASRALESLGEGEVAGRLLVFGTGLVRPALWEISAGASMWVLDLRQLTVPSDAPLELVLFRSLEAVIEATAEMWDETRGAGVLGLRHVCRTAAALLHRGLHTPQARRLADDLRAHCAGRLGELRRRRGWRQTPDVVNLDF